ncbi:hypothetical protein COEREDRAFT_7304 [Coemansia reversa NRRL 1564]|uniref:Uncharacterized protein n=1 Tax=Coemansia reversa (strain ATCC 12441 / NRRL 1564) TaxID=763665 RepID=A0A2G5BFE0_COERN|nr:hypothetical protein COEREDRAFT_7304 [Coemansia reversa NRRL 1564]|eukprot:PIA17711.1 hypothetical protein COEREDRAFT_7304 [Coemansia reversa NRRL 1564]
MASDGNCAMSFNNNCVMAFDGDHGMNSDVNHGRSIDGDCNMDPECNCGLDFDNDRGMASDGKRGMDSDGECGMAIDGDCDMEPNYNHGLTSNNDRDMASDGKRDMDSDGDCNMCFDSDCGMVIDGDCDMEPDYNHGLTSDGKHSMDFDGDCDMCFDGDCGMKPDCNRGMAPDGNRNMYSNSHRDMAFEGDHGIDFDSIREMYSDCNRGMYSDSNRDIASSGDNGMAFGGNHIIDSDGDHGMASGGDHGMASDEDYVIVSGNIRDMYPDNNCDIYSNSNRDISSGGDNGMAFGGNHIIDSDGDHGMASDKDYVIVSGNIRDMYPDNNCDIYSNSNRDIASSGDNGMAFGGNHIIDSDGDHGMASDKDYVIVAGNIRNMYPDNNCDIYSDSNRDISSGGDNGMASNSDCIIASDSNHCINFYGVHSMDLDGDHNMYSDSDRGIASRGNCVMASGSFCNMYSDGNRGIDFDGDCVMAFDSDFGIASNFNHSIVSNDENGMVFDSNCDIYSNSYCRMAYDGDCGMYSNGNCVMGFVSNCGMAYSINHGVDFDGDHFMNTTFVDAKHDPARISTAARLIEFLIAVVFLFQYIIRYVVINANHRSLEHAVVLFAFVAPIAAFFISVRHESIRNSYMSAGVMAIFYPARFLRLHYAVDRLIAIAASMRYVRLTIIRQEIISLCSDIIVAILFFASLVHSGVNWYCQANNVVFEGFSFLDTIYSIVMSGVGEDGPIPPSTFYQIISMAILALIALAIPSRISKLVDLAVNTSTYSKAVALPTATRHALVCGYIEIESVSQFLQEFFNADHGSNIFKTTIVILHSEEPSMRMKALLRDPMYVNRVFYVKGRATSLKALKRARADLAACVYILTRKVSNGTGVEEDAETVLIALALSAFRVPFSHKTTDNKRLPVAPKFQVYAQTILPGSITHLTYLQTARIICVDEMRLGIMAQNCATPGFATLAFMLSTSVGDHVNWDFSGVFTEDIAVSVGSYSRSRSPHNHIGHHPTLESDAGYYQVLLAPRNYILQKYDMLFAISTDVQAVLSAVMFAERVSIKSTKIRKNSWSTRVHEKVKETSRSDNPVNHPVQRGFRDILASNMHIEMPERPTTIAPMQVNSPRRVIARPLNDTRQSRKSNYISDSDSSYFSPAHNIESITEALPQSSSIKGVMRTRVERVARRHDQVPMNIRNHIVICDSSKVFPRSIEFLIQSLKNAYEDEDLSIVILSAGEVDGQVKLILNDFSNVYVVRGTPLLQADLRRAHIEQAQKAIVLGGSQLRTSDTKETSNDSSAILTNMNIQQLCGCQFFVTTELLDIENIRYLDHTQLLGEPLLKRTFMGGHIFTPALIDTALCQCYFSSHILDVLRHLTFSHSPCSSVSSTIDTPKAEEANVIQPFCPGKLSLLYVPSRFIGKRYDTLVLTLMKQHGCIPLGLYRIVSSQGQVFAAVMCNPLPSLSLISADAVYVLGPGIVGWNHVTEGLRALDITHPPQHSESVSPVTPGAGKGSQGTESNQSRHTVYSHNTNEVLAIPVNARTETFNDDMAIQADVSDNDKDHVTFSSKPEDMV